MNCESGDKGLAAGRSESSSEVARALTAIQSGHPDDIGHFWALVNDSLRRIASRLIGKRARSGGMIQTTAVLNEAFLRLSGKGLDYWRGEAHFRAAAGRTLRLALIDWIRREDRAKRGGRHRHVKIELADGVALNERISPLELLALDEALTELAAEDRRCAEVVELRFFGSLKVEEIAETLGVSPRTVNDDWKYARSWLHGRLST